MSLGLPDRIPLEEFCRLLAFLCVVISWVGRGPTMGCSPVQSSLRNDKAFVMYQSIMKRNRPRSLVREINGTREHCKRDAVREDYGNWDTALGSR